jgi:CDGSH iron-sulfur domain-containing protein 3
MPVIAQKSPYPVTVEAGKKYAWCACGRSKSQPFCDGSHKGSEYSPIIHKAEKSEEVWFCGCKHSKDRPFCDGTHNTL